MKWTRTCYGVKEEIIMDDKGKPLNVRYKVIKRGKKERSYTITLEGNLCYIRRYGKKLTLEGFILEDEGTTPLTLNTYLRGKKSKKKSSLYTYKDYKYFMYIETRMPEIAVQEFVLMTKNLILESYKNKEKEQNEINVVDVIKSEIAKIDNNAVVINGFDAIRLR